MTKVLMTMGLPSDRSHEQSANIEFANSIRCYSDPLTASNSVETRRMVRLAVPTLRCGGSCRRPSGLRENFHPAIVEARSPATCSGAFRAFAMLRS